MPRCASRGPPRRSSPRATEALFRLGSSLERAGTSGGSRDGLPEAPRGAAQRRGHAELPRLHVGGSAACSSNGRARCSRRRWRASRATPRTSTRSAGRTSGSGDMDAAERNLREAARREPTDPDHRGAPRRSRDEAGRHRERDPQLGEGARAQVRGSPSASRRSSAEPARPSPSVDPAPARRLRRPRLALCSSPAAPATPLRVTSFRPAPTRRGKRSTPSRPSSGGPRTCRRRDFSTTRRWERKGAPSVPGTLAVTYDGTTVRRASLTGPFGSRVAEYDSGRVTGEDQPCAGRRSGLAARRARRGLAGGACLDRRLRRRGLPRRLERRRSA